MLVFHFFFHAEYNILQCFFNAPGRSLPLSFAFFISVEGQSVLSVSLSVHAYVVFMAMWQYQFHTQLSEGVGNGTDERIPSPSVECIFSVLDHSCSLLRDENMMGTFRWIPELL